MSGEYTVNGRVTHRDGTPALDVTVVAIDVDLGADDPLGATGTRPDGSFEVSAAASALGTFEGTPEVRLSVFRDGDVIHEQTVNPDPVVSVDLTVEREEPLSMETVAEAMCDMHHGMTEQRGMRNVPSAPFHPGQGRFGRMFPYLEAADHPVGFLQDLGLPGGPLDESAVSRSVGSSSLPAGIAFLGQFIDHDITLDPLSSLARRTDPDATRNFRTPGLDLDSVYGLGPEAAPYLYESPMQGGDSERLLVATDGRADVPRNREGTALVGDHRNDENHILSQFQYAMLEFHNAIVEWLPDSCSEVFERANQLARWHYHWVVLEEFLPAVCDEEVVDRVRGNRQYYTVGRGDERYMPLEFSVAAYRYGHSQIRQRYRVNAGTERALFGRGDSGFGMGFEAPSEAELVDWRYLFDFGAEVDTQQARKVDPLVASDLLDLPFVDGDAEWESSLASRNLVRGQRLQLPSGQAVARALGVDPLSNERIGFDQAIAEYESEYDSLGADTEAPLWYYVLAEARELGGGDHLGPVGSRIVAETIVGLLESDPASFLTVQPDWTPELPASHSGAGEFRTVDLLEFAVGGRNDA